MATFHKRLTKLGKPPLLISFFVAIREYRYAYAAAAFLTFGRFGWMGRIAGALLGMMLIGNNSTVHQDMGGGGQSNDLAQAEGESQSRGMHR